MIQQTQELICQSCGMPMREEGDFGKNADDSKNSEYCTYCYQKGKFTKPDITMEQMINAVSGMMAKYGVPEKEAKQKAKGLIPKLKRWKSK